MNTKSVRSFLVASVVVAAAAGPAFAHPGHGDASFGAGLAHPFLGADHLLAMAAIGAWAGQRGGRAAWLMPLVALGAVAAGGALGTASIALPGVEAGLLASIVVLGSLVALAIRAPLAASCVLVGAFALLHGHAHGTELPAGADAGSYAAGFVLATAMLLAGGAALAHSFAARGHAQFVRVAGAFVVIAGVVIALA